jgi:hypothetical protein
MLPRELLWPVLPVLWNAAVLDRLLLAVRIALLGRCDNRRVDDLAAHREKAGLARRRVELLKQGVNRVRLLQRFAERPDRIRSRRLLFRIARLIDLWATPWRASSCQGRRQLDGRTQRN